MVTDSIFNLMNKLNFKKIEDFEKNKNEIDNYQKVSNFANMYKINSPNWVDNLFLGWLNFDQKKLGIKTDEIAKIFEICEKNWSLPKKDCSKINILVACLNAWNAINCDELLEKIDNKTWSLINLIDIFKKDIINECKKFCDKIGDNEQNINDNAYILDLIKQLFECNNIKDLKQKISKYCNFLNNQDNNAITLDEELYDYHESVLLSMAKTKYLKKIMDTTTIKNSD